MRNYLFLFILFLTGTASAQSGYWKKVLIADSVSLTDIRFSDSLTGYAAGQGSINTDHGNTTIYKTSDGGDSWKMLQFDGLTKEPAHGNRIGLFVVGDSGIFISNTPRYQLIGSTNQGLTWRALDSTMSGSSFAFWSATGGIRYDYHSFRKTTDGGVTWSALPFSHLLDSILNKYAINQLGVKDSLHWIFPIASGELLLSLRTSDGGKTWESINSADGGWQAAGGSRFQILPKSNGDLYLNFPGSSTPLLYSADFGASWTPLLSLPNSYESIIAPISRDTVWAIGTSRSSYNDGAYSTINFGGNWSEDTASFLGVPLNDITFLDSQHGWILGDSTNLNVPYSNGSAYVYIYQPTALGVPQPATEVNRLTCYPNPAMNVITVSGFARFQHTFIIYDMLGRNVENGKLPSDGRVDISSLLPGSYTVTIADEGTASFVKLR